MDRKEQMKRTQRIQETGGRLRGGTVGNVWEWGPKSAREDYLFEMSDDVFDAFMDHCEDVTYYEAKLKDLASKATAS